MKHTCMLLVSLLLTSTFLAQDFQGEATYKSKRKMDIELDSTQIGGERYNQIIAMLKKNFEKTYILTFNKEESIYKEDEILEAPQPEGMQFVVASTDGSDILYKNTKEQRYTSQNEVFGKVFLIKDNLENPDWTMHGETKNIGNYTCHKATMKRQVEVFESSMSINGDKDLSETAEPKIEEITITAWYTMQVPVNSGPAKYQGLPGLILEVNDGTETIICSKIVLNPKDKVSIVEPDKGKEVNQLEFEEIVEKKMQEMNDRYKHNRDGDGERIEIRIGG
ncbi:GLPGLI family protein [Yeosuana sp. MJ-SS3]|uniref:GLPGLI family protein n=1 Tax=Gilvirhabdus luticola TaxID=3079858 RepID=A0ABU3U607_9FLAO|nr:GLPGLI family protein [Yeosuana sp. MJ-SS3]MDU8885847.1 GLPGLI family protein [Yeosuana sp. MJ-SS3]